MDPLSPGIGTSDFQKLRNDHRAYVDKTRFVSDVLRGPEVQLCCRPRRFGKTLNLSTLRYFLERREEDRSALFEGLAVWKDEAARAHFAKHPVIWLSFTDVKGRTWDLAWRETRGVIAREFRRLRPQLESSATPEELEALLRGSGETGDPTELATALPLLSSLLLRATGAPVVVLIDECDTPVHSAAANGYYDDAMAFFRGFYGSGLKDNSSLDHAVMMGILKVAKEGIFSGLNHMRVDHVLKDTASSAFGFTDDEVEALRRATGTAISMSQFREWYNGYRIGEHTLYNPWSVLACIDLDRASGPKPHWASTGGVIEVAHLIWRGDDALARDMQRRLNREPVRRHLPDGVSFADRGIDGAAAVATLVHAGYLTFTERSRQRGGWVCDLVVPNRDVDDAFAQVAAQWMDGGTAWKSEGDDVTTALLDGHEAAAKRALDVIIPRTLSYHLVGGNDPEKVFHAFVAGLLVRLDKTHHVWTDVEAGYGRADLLVAPKVSGGRAFVMELKRVERGKGGIAGAIAAAKAQIEQRDYARKLAEFGPKSVVKWAMVWEGKKVTVKVV